MVIKQREKICRYFPVIFLLIVGQQNSNSADTLHDNALCKDLTKSWGYKCEIQHTGRKYDSVCKIKIPKMTIVGNITNTSVKHSISKIHTYEISSAKEGSINVLMVISTLGQKNVVCEHGCMYLFYILFVCCLCCIFREFRKLFRCLLC